MITRWKPLVVLLALGILAITTQSQQSTPSIVNSISLYFLAEPQQHLRVHRGSLVRINCQPSREEEQLEARVTQNDEAIFFDREHTNRNNNTDFKAAHIYRNKQITEWKHNDKYIDFSKTTTASRVSLLDNGSLQIRNITPSDAGTYQCVTTYRQLTILSRVGHIKVLPYPSSSSILPSNSIFDDDIFSRRPKIQKITGLINENVLLECPINKLSPTTSEGPPYYYHDPKKLERQDVCYENNYQNGIYWRMMSGRRSRDLDDDYGVFDEWEKVGLDNFVNPKSGIMELLNVSKKSQVRDTVFACFDKSTDELIARMKVRLRKRRGKDLRLLKQPDDEVAVLRDDTLMGPTIILTCAVNTPRSVTVRWFHENEEILSVFPNPEKNPQYSANSRYNLIGSASLEISNLKLIDQGLYRCTVESQQYGLLESNAAKLTIYQPPRFISKPKTRFTYEDLHVVFPCQAVGNPKPRIQWIRHGSEITGLRPISNDHGNTFVTENESDLRIRGVISFDQGYYQCIATNCVGSVHADAKLIILNTEEDKFSTDSEMTGENNSDTSLVDEPEKEESKNVARPHIIPKDVFQPPQDLKYTLRFYGAIEVTWEEPLEITQWPSQTLDYEVNLYNLLDKTSQNHIIPGPSSTIPSEYTEEQPIVLTVLKDLDAPASYEFRVRAVSRSPTLQIIAYGQYSDAVQVDIPDIDEIPLPVIDFAALPITSSTIELSWKVSDSYDINLEGFLIRYSKTDSDTLQVQEVRLGKFYEFTLDELEPFTEYSIQMFTQGLNGATSSSSEQLLVQTLPALPEEPPTFNVTQPSRDEPKLLVKLKLPPESSWNGKLLEVKLSYENSDQQFSKVVTVDPERLDYEVLLDDLLPTETYTIRLMLKNQVGWGEPTSRITKEVLAPLPKQFLTVEEMTYRAGLNMIILKWKPNEKADFYQIEWGTKQNAYEFRKNTRKNDALVNLKNLTPATLYFVTIIARTRTGSYGEPLVFQVYTASQISRPEVSGLSVKPVAGDKLQLLWADPFYEQGKNKDIITRYIVHYREAPDGDGENNGGDLALDNPKQQLLLACYDFQVPCNITGLIPYEQYEIFVKAGENGRRSGMVRARTMADTPNSSIENLKVVLKPGNEFRVGGERVRQAKVNFNVPNRPFGLIKSYTVQVTDENNERTADIQSVKPEVVIDNLVESKTYHFSVFFSNHVGNSPLSEKVSLTVKPWENNNEDSGGVPVVDDGILFSNAHTYWLLLILLGSLCLLLLACITWFTVHQLRRRKRKQTTDQVKNESQAFLQPSTHVRTLKQANNPTPAFSSYTLQPKRNNSKIESSNGLLFTDTMKRKKGSGYWINDPVWNNSNSNFDDLLAKHNLDNLNNYSTQTLQRNGGGGTSNQYNPHTLTHTQPPNHTTDTVPQFYATMSRRQNKPVMGKSQFTGLIPPGSESSHTHNKTGSNGGIHQPSSYHRYVPTQTPQVPLAYQNTQQYGTLSRAQMAKLKQMSNVMAARPNFPRTNLHHLSENTPTISEQQTNSSSMRNLPPPPPLPQKQHNGGMHNGYHDGLLSHKSHKMPPPPNGRLTNGHANHNGRITNGGGASNSHFTNGHTTLPNRPLPMSIHQHYHHHQHNGLLPPIHNSLTLNFSKNTNNNSNNNNNTSETNSNNTSKNLMKNGTTLGTDTTQLSPNSAAMRLAGDGDSRGSSNKDQVELELPPHILCSTPQQT